LLLLDAIGPSQMRLVEGIVEAPEIQVGDVEDAEDTFL